NGVCCSGVCCSGVCCSGVREVGLDRGWPERGACRLRTSDLTRAAARFTEEGFDLVDGLAGSSGDAFATLSAEWMLDRDHVKTRDAEGPHLALGEPLEDRRADDRARGSRLGQLDGVVETPRCAGPSVGG